MNVGWRSREFPLSGEKAWSAVKTTPDNQFLASLTAHDLDSLRPHLREMRLLHHAVLAKADEEVSVVYLPESGVISLVVGLADGQMVEVAMIGCDSLFGAATALDGRNSLSDAIVQVAGFAQAIDSGHLRRLADGSATLRATIARHEEFLLAQALQTAACNATHPLDARLAKWLLRAHDLTGADSMALTQEFLAQMLGVQRSSVSVTANLLQQAGLIRYTRGQITIVDHARLEGAACECRKTLAVRGGRLMRPNGIGYSNSDRESRQQKPLPD